MRPSLQRPNRQEHQTLPLVLLLRTEAGVRAAAAKNPDARDHQLCVVIACGSDVRLWTHALPIDLGPVVQLLRRTASPDNDMSAAEAVATAVLGVRQVRVVLDSLEAHLVPPSASAEAATAVVYDGVAFVPGRPVFWTVRDGAAAPSPARAAPAWGLVHVPRTGGTALEIAAAHAGLAWGYVRHLALAGDANGQRSLQTWRVSPPAALAWRRRRRCRAWPTAGTLRSALAAVVPMWHRSPGDASTAALYPPGQKLFAVVRDPTERAISAYGYDCARKRPPAQPSAEGLNAFIRRCVVENHPHFVPQAQLVCDPRRPALRVFRFERDLPGAVNEFLRQEGLPAALLADGPVNLGRAGALGSADLAPDVAHLLSAHFAQDYQRFGYAAPARPALPPAVQPPASQQASSHAGGPAPSCGLASLTFVQRIEHSYLMEFYDWYHGVCGVQQLHFITTDRRPVPATLRPYLGATVFWHYLEDECYLPNGEPNGALFYDTARLTRLVRRELRQAEWVLYVDSDEYLVVTPTGGSLADLLEQRREALSNVAAVVMRWYVFPVHMVHASAQLRHVLANPVGTRQLTSTKYLGRPDAVRFWNPHVPDVETGRAVVRMPESTAMFVHCAARCVEHVLLKQMYQCFNDAKTEQATTGRFAACVTAPATTPFLGLPPRICDFFYMRFMVAHAPKRMTAAQLRVLARHVPTLRVSAMALAPLLPNHLPFTADAVKVCARQLAQRHPLRWAPGLSSRLRFLEMCNKGQLPPGALTEDGRGGGPDSACRRRPVTTTSAVGRRARVGGMRGAAR